MPALTNRMMQEGPSTPASLYPGSETTMVRAAILLSAALWCLAHHVAGLSDGSSEVCPQNAVCQLAAPEDSSEEMSVLQASLEGAGARDKHLSHGKRHGKRQGKRHGKQHGKAVAHVTHTTMDSKENHEHSFPVRRKKSKAGEKKGHEKKGHPVRPRKHHRKPKAHRLRKFVKAKRHEYEKADEPEETSDEPEETDYSNEPMGGEPQEEPMGGEPEEEPMGGEPEEEPMGGEPEETSDESEETMGGEPEETSDEPEETMNGEPEETSDESEETMGGEPEETSDEPEETMNGEPAKTTQPEEATNDEPVAHNLVTAKTRNWAHDSHELCKFEGPFLQSAERHDTKYLQIKRFPSTLGSPWDHVS